MPATRVCSSTSTSRTPRPFPPSGARSSKAARPRFVRDAAGDRLAAGLPMATAPAPRTATAAAEPSPRRRVAEPPAPAAAPAVPLEQPVVAAPDPELLGGVAAAMALVKAHRMHGHLAARLDPLGVRAGRRSRARPAPPRAEADRRAAGAHPGVGPARPRRRRDARGGAAAPQGDLLRLDGLRDRAHLRPRAAGLAPQGDRVVAVPHAARRRRAAAALRAPLRGRGHGALPPPRVPRPEAVLARGPRRPDPDARRVARARGSPPARTRS